MPESGDYFCSKACLKVFNEKPAEVYDAIPNDSKPPDGPNVLKVRHRLKDAPETGMGHVDLLSTTMGWLSRPGEPLDATRQSAISQYVPGVEVVDAREQPPGAHGWAAGPGNRVGRPRGPRGLDAPKRAEQRLGWDCGICGISQYIIYLYLR